MVEGVRLVDRSPRVVIGSVDARVKNHIDDKGCSVDDLIADEMQWPSHGAFLQHVTATVLRLTLAREINVLEAAAITVAAARSRVGR